MEATRINSWQIKDNSNSSKKTWQQREVRANCTTIRLVSEQRLLQEKDLQTCFSFRSSALMSPLVTLLICSIHLPRWSWKLVQAAYCDYHPDKMDCNTISRNFNQWPPSQSQQNNLLLLQVNIYYKFLFKHIPTSKLFTLEIEEELRKAYICTQTYLRAPSISSWLPSLYFRPVCTNSTQLSGKMTLLKINHIQLTQIDTHNSRHEHTSSVPHCHWLASSLLPDLVRTYKEDWAGECRSQVWSKEQTW